MGKKNLRGERESGSLCQRLIREQIYYSKVSLMYLMLHLSLRTGPALARSSYSIIYRIIYVNDHLLWPALGWGTHRNHFFRTEAIDLLKTHDRAPGPNPTRTHFRSSPRGKTVGAAFRIIGQVSWLMSIYNMTGKAALFPRRINGTKEGLKATLVKLRMSRICGSEHPLRGRPWTVASWRSPALW